MCVCVCYILCSRLLDSLIKNNYIYSSVIGFDCESKNVNVFVSLISYDFCLSIIYCTHDFANYSYSLSCVCQAKTYYPVTSFSRSKIAK